MQNINYSEIFYSPQGEGHYTGVCSGWLRLFSCNLQCDGFGQKDPTDSSTYELPYKSFDASSAKKMTDLPVFEKGCDSSYSWAKKYRHLTQSRSITEIADELENILPTSTFKHTHSNQQIHLCITGGEPLLQQGNIVSLFKEFETRNNLPKFVTFETNGTQQLSDEFKKYFREYISKGNEVFFSISPKLYSITGEIRDKALKPSYIKEYYQLSNQGQLKFVIDHQQASHDELEEVIAILRQNDIWYNIWCMPSGALKEQQQSIAREVSDFASEKGYYTCARVHTYLFGNEIGT